MDTTAWIQLGVLAVALASAAGAVVRTIGKKIDDKFDKTDMQFAKVDLKFDDVGRQVTDKFNQLTVQFNNLKDVANERHTANVDRMARIEGRLSALLPQKVNGEPK